jgi:carboxyl-terminal processing protease
MCAGRLRVRSANSLSLVAVVALAAQGWSQQQISNLDRDRALDMLQVVANEVRKNYYDPKFHGLDWDAKVAEAKEKIGKTTSMNMALSHIAAALDTLNDSHTFFLPPEHSNRFDYGWQYQMVGEHCFVTEVRPGSDLEAKGVKPGDEIMTLNGFAPTRGNLWKMQYVYSVLRPQPALRLSLRDPSGGDRQVEVAAKVRERRLVTDLTGHDAPADVWDFVRQGENARLLMRARSVDFGEPLMILKIPEFRFAPAEIDDMISRARRHSALIIDLRGNPGGSVDTLKYLVSGMFDKDLKIADRVGRKEAKPEVAKASHHEFSGKLVVLVDATSASAAELFARVMQIEKRGTVIGDHTSGSVMEAKHYNEHIGLTTMVFYGASITEWDLIMADGKSLEHTGVTPDEIVLPSAMDLAAGRDSVMSHAAQRLGVNLNPEKAGKLFPYEWPPE